MKGRRNVRYHTRHYHHRHRRHRAARGPGRRGIMVAQSILTDDQNRPAGKFEWSPRRRKHFDDLELCLQHKTTVNSVPISNRVSETIMLGRPVAARVRITRRELRTSSTVTLLITD